MADFRKCGSCFILAGVLLLVLPAGHAQVRLDRADMTGEPVPMQPPPDMQAGAGTEYPPFRQQDRKQSIEAVNTQEHLRRVVQKEIEDRIKQLKQQYPEGRNHWAPDEIDFRIDAGHVEFALGRPEGGDDPNRIVLKEITFKAPKITGTSIQPEWSIGISGTWENPDWNGKIKVGFAYEKSIGRFAGEAKYGFDVDVTKTTNDYYDGEWQKESEWRIVRALENILAKTDFYVGGAVGVSDPDMGLMGQDLNVGVEASYNTRDRWTNWAVEEMHDAFDRLQIQQEHEAQWRRRKMEDEARRAGIEPRGLNNRQLIAAIHAAWDRDPALRRTVFNVQRGHLTTRHQQRDWYCTNRPIIEAPVVLPPILEQKR